MPSTLVSNYRSHPNYADSRRGPSVTASSARKKTANQMSLLPVDKAVEYILSQPDAH